MMRRPRPHDLLRVEGLDDYLPDSAPSWVRAALRRTSWVVVLRTATKSLGHTVGVRGTTRSQRYRLVAMLSLGLLVGGLVGSGPGPDGG